MTGLQLLGTTSVPPNRAMAALLRTLVDSWSLFPSGERSHTGGSWRDRRPLRRDRDARGERAEGAARGQRREAREHRRRRDAETERQWRSGTQWTRHKWQKFLNKLTMKIELNWICVSFKIWTWVMSTLEQSLKAIAFVPSSGYN